MPYVFIGGQMVWLSESQAQDLSNPEVKAQVEQTVKQEYPNQQLTNEDITKIMNVPGAAQNIPTSAPSATEKTVTGATPVPEIIRQQKSEAVKQQQQKDLQQISEVPTTSEKATSTIPFERKYYEAIDFGNNQGRNIYRALTPWREERGETFGGWVVSIPKRMVSVPEQNELKEQYELEHNQPLWTRILFGGDTVYKDKRGNYCLVVAGEAPLVTPAGSTAKLLQTIPVNYEKILDAARKSRLEQNWKSVISAMQRGNINDVPSSVAYMQKKLGMTVVKDVKYGKYVPRTAADIFADEVRDFRAWEQIYNTGKKIQPALNTYKPIKVFGVPLPTIIATPEDVRSIDLIAKKAEQASPSKAIQELTENEILSIITISNPEVITKILTEVEPEVQSKLITDVEEAIKEATESKELTKTQEEQATKVINEIKERTQEQTETQTQTQTQTQAKTQTKTKTKTKTDVEIKTDTPTEKGKEDEPSRTGEGTSISQSRWPRRELSAESQKSARKHIKAAGGAIAWRMGQLGGKDRWDVVVNPYTDDEHYYMLLGEKPAGVTVVKKGKGSAYGTTQTIKGKSPDREVHVDSGFSDIIITPKGKTSVKMRVVADPKMETTGDITIGRGRISERPSRLSDRAGGISGKRGRISPKMPKLK